MKHLLISFLLLSQLAFSQKITWANKVTDDGSHATNMVFSAADANQIKTVVNSHADQLTRFNVKTYGAIGDSVTDDGAAIAATIAACRAAGGGTVYFPIGKYRVVTHQFLLDFNVNIVGEGYGPFKLFSLSTGVFPYTCVIYYQNTTGHLFTFDKDPATALNYPIRTIEKISLVNTASTLPTAGSGIRAMNNAMQFIIRDVQVNRFYVDIDLVSTTYWLMDNCRINGPVAYGIRLGNNIEPDLGDWSINNCIFSSGQFTAPNGGAIAFYWRAGGGGKIVNTKFNAASYTNAHAFKKFIYADNIEGITTLFQVSNCSFENFQESAIHMDNQNGTPYMSYAMFDNCQIATNNDDISTVRQAVKINNYLHVSFDNIMGRCWSGPVPYPFIYATNITGLKIGGNCTAVNFKGYYEYSNCTDVWVEELKNAAVVIPWNPVLSFNTGFSMYKAQTADIAFSVGTVNGANNEGTRGVVTIDCDGTHDVFFTGLVALNTTTINKNGRNRIEFEYSNGETSYKIFNYQVSTPLISDLFTGGNTTDINGRTTTTGGATWTKVAGVSTGTIGITSGVARLTSSGTTQAKYTLNAGKRNVDFRATIGTQSTGSNIVILAYTDDNNALYCILSTGHIFQSVGGTSTQVFTSPATPVSGDIMRYILNGTTLTVYRNGSAFGSIATVSAALTSQNHGIYNYQDLVGTISKIEIY